MTVADRPGAETRTPSDLNRKTRILLVGGGKPADGGVSCQLEPRGYKLHRVRELSPFLRISTFDLVLFALPATQDEQVIQHCTRLRLRLLSGPAVVVVQEGADPEITVRVLEAGADDCMAPPHNPREVVARIRALLRRRSLGPARYGGRHCVFDGHELDVTRLVIRSPDGRQVEITPAQHRLLLALLARPGEVVSREDLLEQVLGADTISFDRAIDVHVSRLKRRLAQVCSTDLITAYRGVGYRLDVQSVTH